MNMKQIVFVFLLALCSTFCVFAQGATQEEPKVIQMRKDIGIDYSMPDFKTKKIDGAIIVPYIAGMLNLLQKYYNDGACYWKLAAVVKEQKGMVS